MAEGQLPYLDHWAVVIEARCPSECVASSLNACCLRSHHHQPTGSFLPYRPSVAAGTPLPGIVFSPSVVSVASLPLARRCRPSRYGERVFGSLPVSLSVAVYVKVTSLS
ncbi:hypothetical protein O9993_05565 [Vibrio lentus]|nr:hypothetical protein [Vibrio lentus]